MSPPLNLPPTSALIARELRKPTLIFVCRTPIAVSQTAIGDQGINQLMNETGNATQTFPVEGDAPAKPLAPMDCLRRIKSISGLTWEALANEVFDVAPRSLHNWADGKAMNLEHEKHVYAVLSALEGIDPGNPVVMRRLLLQVDARGMTFANRLMMLEYSEVVKGLSEVAQQHRMVAALPSAAVIHDRISDLPAISFWDDTPLAQTTRKRRIAPQGPDIVRKKKS